MFLSPVHTMLSLALKGIRVLDFTRLYPGPLCTLMLADLGADIIKIEGPAGEMGRSMPPVIENHGAVFLQLNRSKRSLVIDLKHPSATPIIKTLVQKSDVLVESFRPGVMQRFGLDFETLQNNHPRLVYCSISGYGQTGPDAQRPGHDLNYISAAGILNFSGDAKHGYIIPPIQIADTLGAFQATTAILAALLARERTGTGEYLDISLLDGALFTMLIAASAYLTGHDPQKEQYLTGKLACYNVYRTSDHRYLALALLEPRFWEIFCRKLDLPHLFGLQFQENQQELIDILSNKLATEPLQYWLDYFHNEDVCLTPLATVQEALTSEYAKHRQILTQIGYSFGQFWHMKTPFVKGEVESVGAPELGQHTRGILEEAGFSRKQIDDWVRDRIVQDVDQP